MSDHTIHATMARKAHHERDTGSWKNSLRLRLLTGTLIWVLGALLLTGWGLRALFAEHLAQQLRSQLVAKLDRLSGAVSFQMDQPVQITVAPFSGDPLLQQPLSGMYWQVDQLDTAGQATVHAGIQRSRSLWDQTLDWPLFKADKTWEPTLPLHAPATYGHMSDDNGNGLVVVTRTVQLPETDAPALRLMVAADTAMLAVPLQRFTKMLIAALCVLAAGLVVAVVVQLQLALAPLTALRRQLAAVSQGEAPEIQGEHPTEIMPLVQEFNHVLRMNAEMVERARTQAGNLAHAVNTPLSIMGNAAAQQDDALATLVREQVASASRQVEHHLARARAAAAAAQQGHGLRIPLKQPLQSALGIRQQHAKTLLALDDVIVKQVEALKAKGLTSPYLKSFVVARVNPIRFRPKDAPALSFDDALDRMTQAAAKFNPDKIKMDDLAKSGGASDEVD